MSLTAKVRKPGYLYVYLSNENEVAQEVYFDDLAIKHVEGVAIQQNDYYPFGLTFNSYRRENATENRYLYNQGVDHKTFLTERITDLDLNIDLSRYRAYDPAIGRWWQVDPMSDQAGQEVWSPYNYAFNNPIRYNDPEGDCIPCLAAGLAAKYSALIASMSSRNTQQAATRLMTNSSSTIQSRASANSPVTPIDNKAMATLNDAKVVTDATAKNAKTLTNEVSKDGLAAAKAVGTGLEVTGVAAPLGAAINTTATVLDEARQVKFEEKSVSEAGTDLVIEGTINAAFSGLGNAAKSTAKKSDDGKAASDKVVDGYSFGFSNFTQWVTDMIIEHQSDKKENK